MLQEQDSTSSKVESVHVKQFYGKGNSHSIKKKSCRPRTGLLNRSQPITELPYRLSNLCGPSQVWRVFPKQKEALEFVRTKRSGLVTFAFQQSDGIRLFLVAHPQIFWHYDVQKNPSQRCSFEVIPESSASKLYFDLEYEIKHNPSKKGSLIVNSFIELVLYFIQVVFSIKATRENVLHLDSSTHEKFSRHLIFQLGCHVFCNYLSVGEFVRFVCQKLLLYLETSAESVGSNNNQHNKPAECKCCQLSKSKNTACVKDSKISISELEELVVLDRKGNKSLICDLSVYSKNRHFRLYQNTKWMKNAPLVLSEDNLYSPLLSSKEIISDEITTEAFFLDSLVSYVRLSENCSKKLLLINFVNPLHSCTVFGGKDNILFQTVSKIFPVFTDENYTNKSPYPEVDDFISSIVSPGRIWRLAYFSSSNSIVYDIVGNRYCQNIKRQHRSNNVKYIVHLENCVYYQKCHDIDCSTFRSNPLLLPDDLKFQLNDECNISDSDLNEIASVVEVLSCNLSQED